jgi:Asp-tRNA(Asn)/Glu-tRNA(Gln) amidotransferase A subunit family amidase
MVPVALGTQTGGSIIRPASWCGVYAMKPSFGLIPRTGVLKTTDTLDSIGFFSRSIDDLALMLDVLRVHGDNFPIQERNLQKYTSLSPNPWRIGLCRSHLDDELSPYVHKAMADFKLELKARANIEVIDVVLPLRVKSFQALHRRIYHPCLAYYLNTERESASQHLSPGLKAIFEDAATIPASDYATALEEQVFLAKELEQLLIDNQLDLMLSHSSNGSAPTHEPDRSHDLNQLWTMSWLPVVTVPHFTCPQGRPFGFQVIGPRYADYQVLSFVQGLKHDGLIAPESMIADVDEAFVPRAECLAI